MDAFSKKLNLLLAEHIHESAIISAKRISFSATVLDACKQNLCGKYGTSWMCPPAVGNIETLKEKYTAFQSAFVFTTKHEIEDSFDFEGMMQAGAAHTEIESRIADAVRNYGGVILGAGGCKLCESCTYPTAPCRFSNKAKPSVEACGIDVVHLANECGIRYHNGENTVTYFSVVFYNEK